MANSTVIKCLLDREIERPRSDKQSYRFLELKNNLKVVLVSSDDHEKAAAALDVYAGSAQEPFEFPGLAHFLEHMLFLGSKKYPEPCEYQDYIQQRGGTHNAYTASYHTSYFFTINPEHLHGALDRFAQFFLDPLLSLEWADKEVESIESELMMRMNSDERRAWNLLRVQGNPKHPFCRFDDGNRETLKTIPEQKGVSIEKALRIFYHEAYSSNRMALMVVSCHTLDELQELVVPLFETVPNRHLPLPMDMPSHQNIEPYTSEYTGVQVYVRPVGDISQINFIFFFPPQLKLWEIKPVNLISHLLGHEAKDSLLYSLKMKGLAVSLTTFCLDQDCVSIFCISIDMVPEAMNDENIQIVGDLVFTYINLLRTQPLQKWIFDEAQTLSEINLHFKEMEDPMWFCVRNCPMLHNYPESKFMMASHLLYKFDATSIQDILKLMVPENARIEIVDKKFSDRHTDVEKYFGILHSRGPIYKSYFNSWSKICSLNESETLVLAKKEGIAYPSPNPYIPKDLAVKKVQENNALNPSLLSITDKELQRICKVFFLQDSAFDVPKLFFNMIISTEFASKNLTQWMQCRLFFASVNEMLNEKLYDATLAGLHHGISSGNCPGEIQFTAYGFSDKLSDLIITIVNALIHGVIQTNQISLSYEKMHQTLKRKISNREILSQAKDIFRQMLEEPFYHQEDQLKCLESLDLESIKNLGNEILQSCIFEGLVQGNVFVDEAQALIQDALATLNLNKAINMDNVVNKRVVDVYSTFQNQENDTSALRYTSVCHTPEQRENATYLRILLGVLPFETCVYPLLLDKILSQTFFNVIRTEKQFGYVTEAMPNTIIHSTTFDFIVCTTFNPQDVSIAILQFIEDYLSPNKIDSTLTEQRFNDSRASLINDLETKPRNLMEATDRNFREISRRKYIFDRRDQYIAIARKISIQDMKNFIFEKFMKSPWVLVEIASHGWSLENPDFLKAENRIPDACKQFQIQKSWKDVDDIMMLKQSPNVKYFVAPRPSPCIVEN